MKNNNEHRARKRFGQNFLQDRSIIDQIAQSTTTSRNNTLVEIGPGTGALTEVLLSNTSELHVIELDRDLVALLQEKFADRENLHIHSADALKFDFSTLPQTGQQQKITVVGNLPYNISTPLLFHLFNYLDIIDTLVLMLQKEVVDRITSPPGQKSRGRLGVMSQYYCSTEKLLDAPPESFSPSPKVMSAVVRLTPHQIPVRASNENLFAKIVRAAFAQRRKTLRNNLKDVIDAAAMETVDIDFSRRAETLSVEEFVELSNQLDAD